MAADPTPTARRSRGDLQREAIVSAVRQLLQEGSFADLSVSTISERARIARSGFYFYFESKYDVLALILAEATHELEELTQYFAPRAPGETPTAFARRMVGSAATVFASDSNASGEREPRAAHWRVGSESPEPRWSSTKTSDCSRSFSKKRR